MDARYFGASRRNLLEWLAEEVPTTFLVADRAGSLRGFIVGIPGVGTCEIGPWIAERDSAGVAGNLYNGLVAAAGTPEVAFSGPSTNVGLLEFVKGVRHAELFRTLRMWWGADDFPGDPAGVWAVGGLEKG